MQAIHNNIICTYFYHFGKWTNGGLWIESQSCRPIFDQLLNTIPLVTCINMHHFPWKPPEDPQQHFENETEQVMQIFNSIQQHNQVLTLELEE
jgi:hypothetical protein